MEFDQREVWRDCDKIVRNSAQHHEHWEAAVEEMRTKYEVLLKSGAEHFTTNNEADLISLIYLYDGETR